MAGSRRTRVVLFTLLFFAALGGGLYYVGRGGGLITPGPLAKVHAHIDGEDSCKLCHVRGTGITGGLNTPAQLCLDCHGPIATRLEAKKGYHQHVEKEDCRRCHADHLGLQESLIRWPEAAAPFAITARGKAEPKQFPHQEGTGFALEGAHAKIACEGCHKPALVSDPALVAWEQEKGAEAKQTPAWNPGLDSYLGLDMQCGSCHQDAHVPSQGSDCDKCHGLEKWKPTSQQWVHDPPRTRYPLEGKHKDVKCEACHLVEQDSQPEKAVRAGLPAFAQVIAEGKPRRYRGVGFGTGEFKVPGEQLPDTCKVCHANPHRPGNEVFLRCEDCHGLAGWTPMIEGKFDHAKTGFKLELGHKKPSCADCHGKKEGDKVLALEKREACVDCHQKDDPHKGAFAREEAQAKEQGCGLCHSVEKWKPDTYDRAVHVPPKALALIDGHAIRCEDCHGPSVQEKCALVEAGKARACTEPGPEGKGFKRLPPAAGLPAGALEQACESCHWDPHEGRLTKPGQDCASCHNFKAWHLSDLDEAGHAAIGFPIRGAHVQNFKDCGLCHNGRLPDGSLRSVSLADVKQDGCFACHQVDKGPGTKPRGDVHKGQLGKDCARCHTESVWRPSEYDLARHDKTRFPLRAAHAAVPCDVCHIDPATKLERWKWKSLGCSAVGCHQEEGKKVHAAQFKGQDCKECHGEATWTPSSFGKPQHLSVAKFALEGSHDRACSACHLPLGNTKVVRYEGIPTQCAGCHEDPHLGQFGGRWGDGCSGCHTLERWVPSTFDHDKARFPLKGAHAGIPCETCHPKLDRTFQGQQVKVAHYYPIEERQCDDCHQNPHAKEQAPAPR